MVHFKGTRSMQLHHSSQHCLHLGLMVVAVAVAAAVVVDFCQIGTLNMRQSRLLCWLQAQWSVRWVQEGKVSAKHRKRKVNNIILEAYKKRKERLPGSSYAAHTHTHTHTHTLFTVCSKAKREWCCCWCCCCCSGGGRQSNEWSKRWQSSTSSSSGASGARQRWRC